MLQKVLNGSGAVSSATGGQASHRGSLKLHNSGPQVRHRFTPSKGYDFQGASEMEQWQAVKGLNGAARKERLRSKSSQPCRTLPSQNSFLQSQRWSRALKRSLHVLLPQVARGSGPFVPFGNTIRRACKDHQNMTCN